MASDVARLWDLDIGWTNFPTLSRPLPQPNPTPTRENNLEIHPNANTSFLPYHMVPLRFHFTRANVISVQLRPRIFVLNRNSCSSTSPPTLYLSILISYLHVIRSWRIHSPSAGEVIRGRLWKVIFSALTSRYLSLGVLHCLDNKACGKTEEQSVAITDGFRC